MADKGLALPKFGEWDVNDPASAEGFTVIFDKARDEKRTGGKADSSPKDGSKFTQKHLSGSLSLKGGFAVCNLQNLEGLAVRFAQSRLPHYVFKKTGAAMKL